MPGPAKRRNLFTTDGSDDESDADPFQTLLSSLKVDQKYEGMLKRRKLEEDGADQSEDDDDDTSVEDGERVLMSTEEIVEFQRKHGDAFEVAEDGEEDDSEQGDDESSDDGVADSNDDGDDNVPSDESEDDEDVANNDNDDSIAADPKDEYSDLDDGKPQGEDPVLPYHTRMFSNESASALQAKAPFTNVSGGPPQWRVTMRRLAEDENESVWQLSPSTDDIQKSWPGNVVRGVEPEPSPLQPVVSRYQDLVYTCRKPGDDRATSDLYLRHVVRHVLRTLRTISDNDATLESDPTFEARDQGFTHPTVLIMCPFRSSAHRIVNRVLELLPSKFTRQVSNIKRFNEEFGPPEPDAEEKDRFNRKPSLYKDVFSGNFDDNFRLGIKLGKRSVKLFADFYASDIIIASPLGLRMIVGGEGDLQSERDYDFLSSIEVAVLDQADVFMMQNWEHLQAVLSCMNLIPNDSSHSDFSRLRSWNLDGLAAYHRQMLIFASHGFPELNALSSKHCLSLAGCVRIRRHEFPGVLEQVVLPIRQQFQRFHHGDTPTDASEARFKWFAEEILPQLKTNLSSHILLFVPSYFDYVRIRNLLRSQKVKVALCSEYTKKGSVARARSRFFHGEQKFLLCTERFHFFRRYCIRGAHTIFFYGLPQEPTFYLDFVNAIEPGSHQTTIALFSRFDALALERVVGSSRAARLLSAHKDLHMFC